MAEGKSRLNWKCCPLMVFMMLPLFFHFLSPPSYASQEQSTPPETARVESGTGTSVDIRGYLSTKYVLRSTMFSGRSHGDQDFYEYARFDVSAPESGRYEIHFFGTARQDIDGGQDHHDFFPFEDIGDARNRSHTDYIYDAHVAVNDPAAYVSQLRFGRQAGTRDEPLYFDGIAADIVFTDSVTATVYGGSAAHFDELDDDQGEDALAGAGMDISPTYNSVIGLDYLYVEDKRDFFGFQDQEDHLFSMKLWQRFARFLRAAARFRYLNDEARDIRVSAAATFPEAGFEMSAAYFRQLSPQKELSNELSGYFDIVGETSEYHSLDVRLRKFFGENYAVDLGYYGRRLAGDAKESAFNRDYYRVFAAFDVADRFMEGLTMSVTGEYWDRDDGSYRSAGLDASYAFNRRYRRAELRAGTYYSLYKYDYYAQLGERDNVQTYYARAVMPVGRHFSADGKYEYEDGSDNYHTLSFGVRYDF